MLGRAFETSRCCLVDVDVDGGGRGGAVLFDVKSDGGEGDGFAGQPADALEGEDGVSVRGEGFVLVGEKVSWKLLWWRGFLGQSTMIYLPERSRIVISEGAAIVYISTVRDIVQIRSVRRIKDRESDEDSVNFILLEVVSGRYSYDA